MKRMENLKSIQWMTRFIIVMIVLVLIAIFTGCSKSVSPSRRYAKEHSDKNFWAVMGRNTSFTLSSLKDDLKTAKATKKANRKKAKDEDKKRNILARIEKIKNN